jgi:ribonucleotide monophosphatase NagD (HAD superfamily)
MEQYNLKADETIMIGDRLDTDVKFGNSGRMRSSALVLTGCTTVDEMEELVLHVQNGESGEERSDMIPTIIFPHVGLMVADR